MAGEEGSSGRPEVSKGYAYYVLTVLFLVYVSNFADRQALSILLTDIQKDFGASDTAMGFLTGFPFAVFYTVAGIPIARFADRTSRRFVIAAGLVTWSSMTAVSGLVQSYWQLALARVGVGIGEAAGSPPAHSLISDYFSRERRATALAIYATGVYIGVAIVFAGGAYIAQQFGWRSVFLVIGLSGLPLAVLVRFTIRELPRGYSEPVASGQPVALAEVLRALASNRSFWLVVCGASVQSLSGYGALVWGPTFLIRVHEMPNTQVGLWLGVVIGVTGSLGAYVGGLWTDRLARRDERWYMRLPALESLAGVPFVVGFLFAGSAEASLYCFAPFYLLGAMYVGPMHSMIQSLVVPGMRATASAINLFAVNMIGLGLGPFLVGYLNDSLAIRYGDEAVRYSMLLVGIIGGCASILFYFASRNLPRDLARARAGSSPQ